jgi:hypothetical protein
MRHGEIAKNNLGEMRELTDAEAAEVMRVTKNVIGFLADRGVSPDMAKVALIQSLIEIEKRVGEYETVADARRHLLDLFRRMLVRVAH